MIKKTIHLNFHIKYTQVLDNSNYLYGSIYEKYSETDVFVQYKEDSYIFKLDKEFTVESQKYISNRTWVDLIYYRDNHFIFEYQDDEYQYFQTLDEKRVLIPLKDKKNYFVLQDKLFIFNPKDKNHQNVLVYNDSLDRITNSKISHQELLDYYSEKEKIENLEKIADCLPNYSVIQYIKMDDEYIVVAFEEQYRYIVFRFNLNFDVQDCKEISRDKKYIFHNMYKFKEFYYFIFSMNDINYIVKKYDSKFDLLDEEKIKSCRCEIISMNDNVCLIIDELKKYDRVQKQYKNQESIRNSTLLILN